jgi:hypothetical protein
LDACRRIGLHPKFLEVLQTTYRDMRFFVKDRWGESSTRKQEIGLRQGDPLSVILLLILTTVIMHDAEKEWIKKCEEKQVDLTFTRLFGFDHVLYMDDTNIVQMSALAAQIVVNVIERQAQFYGLEFNMTKVYLILLGIARKLPIPAMKNLAGQLINIVPVEKTLGVPMGGEKDVLTSLVREKANSMRSLMGQYKEIWNANLTTKKKMQKYMALIQQKGLWGLHLMTLGAEEFQHLEMQHHRALRRITKIAPAYASRISDETVRKRAGCPTFETLIRRKQVALLRKVLRRKNEPDWLVCFQKDSLASPFQANRNMFKKRRGRPRALWAEEVVKYIQRKDSTVTRQQLLAAASNDKEWDQATTRLSLHRSQ